MAEAVLPDGSVIKVPDFALETTQTQMLAALKVVVKSNKDTEELYKKFLKEIEDGNKSRDKAEDKAQKTLEEIKKAGQEQQKSFRQQFADRVEGDVQSVFIGAGRAVSGLATAAVLATGAIIGFGAKIFGNLTDNLKDLTQAGLGFTDGMNNSAGLAIIEFNKLGYSTSEATQTMMKFASVTASIGRSGTPGSLTDTIKKFKSMTDNGLSLGMSFKDANEALLEELETRNDLGLLEGSVTNRQLAAASEQIKLQTAYASVLGISADKLREMTKRTLETNTGLIALSSKFGSAIYEGAAGFNTAMAARGEAFGKLSEIFLDAGAQSSVFISEAARDIASASPELSKALRDFGGTLQNNTLTSAEAGRAQAEKIQNIIGRLNNAQIQNLQRIVQAGGAGAESARLILFAYRDFQKTKAAMAKVAELMGGGMNVDLALQARYKFDNSLAQIKTTFDTLVNSLAVQFAPMMESMATQFEKLARAFQDTTGRGGRKIRGIATALQEGFSRIADSVLKLFGFDTSKMVDEDMLRDSVVTKIDRFTKKISDTIDSFTALLEKYTLNAGTSAEQVDWSAMFKDIAKQAAAGILNGIGDFLLSLPGMLIDGAKSLISGFFNDPPAGAEKEVGASIAEGVTKIIGFLLGVGMAKSVGAILFNKLKNKILGESAETLAKQRSGGVVDKVKEVFGKKPGGPSAPGGGPAGGPSAPGGGPAGPGKMDKIANGMKSLGSGIASLGTGLGRFLKAVGIGAGRGIQALFTGIARGLGAFGKPNVLLGGIALGVVSGAVFIAGKAFQQFQTLDWKTIGMGLTAIAGIGVIAAVAGSFAPALLAGAVAIGAIGLALQLFPIDTLQTFGNILNTVVNTVMVGMPPIITAVGDALAKLVEVGAKGFDVIMNSVGTLLERLSVLDAGNLAASALAITAVGVALAGLGAGSIVGGIGNFFGSLFGGGDPFTRLLEVAKSTPELDKLSSSLRTLASVLGTTGDMIDRLAVQPLEDIVTQFTRLWENLAAVELNVLPYQEFAAISTANLLGNAAAINQIAAANRAQNQAYAEFIKLDEAKFRANVQNAFNYNRANKGETEESTGLLDTISNMFKSLRSSPATPVVPTPTPPGGGTTTGTPTGTSVTGSPTTPPEKNQYGKTQLEVLTEIERILAQSKSVLDEIKKNG